MADQKQPKGDKPDHLTVNPERGDAIMRQAFRMKPKPNKRIKPKRRGRRPAKR
jgi:hypothetical protein